MRSILGLSAREGLSCLASRRPELASSRLKQRGSAANAQKSNHSQGCVDPQKNLVDTHLGASLMGLSRKHFALGTLALLASACATLADAASGGDHLPNAGAGPFRALKAEEVGNLRSAPNVLVDDQVFPRDGTVLDADGDLGTPEIFGYFAVTPRVPMTEPDPKAPPRAIVRVDALDGRSFERDYVTVLEVQEPWEGASLGAPAAIRGGGEVFLYYTAAGGVGLARSTDGKTFTRESGPVLAPVSGTWEGGAVPANPGVVQLDDGSFRMFYDVTDAGGVRRIGEASSTDGLSWMRVGDAPTLEPRVDTNPDDPLYDGDSVGAPYPVLGKSSEGRSVLRVYYEAQDALDRRAIGLAARYDPVAGAFERAVGPVFSGSFGPGQPCVLVCQGYSLLLVTQLEGRSKSEQIPAVAAGISPADAVLPPRTK